MTKTKYNLSEILKNRILVLDGAMGTMIQRCELDESDFRGELFANHDYDLIGNNDILCLTNPNIISDIHNKYLESGCDIIETNTFNSNSISQTDYGTQAYCYEINKRAAEIAKNACEIYSTYEKPRFVAGALGPTNKTLSISPRVE